MLLIALVRSLGCDVGEEKLDPPFSLQNWYSEAWIDLDPAYAPLRNHPRCKEVLGKYRAE